jgi:hypothetical protein
MMVIVNATTGILAILGHRRAKRHVTMVSIINSNARILLAAVTARSSVKKLDERLQHLDGRNGVDVMTGPGGVSHTDRNSVADEIRVGDDTPIQAD